MSLMHLIEILHFVRMVVERDNDHDDEDDHQNERGRVARARQPWIALGVWRREYAVLA